METFLTIFAAILVVLMSIGIYIVNAAEQKERNKSEKNRKQSK